MIKVEFFSDVFNPKTPAFVAALATVGMPVVKHAELQDVQPLVLSPTPDTTTPEPVADFAGNDPAVSDAPTGGLLGFSMSLFDSDDDENDDNSPQHLSANSLAVDLTEIAVTADADSKATETADGSLAPTESTETAPDTTESATESTAPLAEATDTITDDVPGDISSDSESDVEMRLTLTQLRSPPPSASSVPTFDDDDDDDAYEPAGIEWTPPGSPVDSKPALAAGQLRLSLKRHSPDDDEPRISKRVRFAI